MKIMHSEHFILIYRQIIFSAKLKNCFQVKVTIKILPHRLTIKSYVGSIEVHPIDKAEELVTLFPGISHIENKPNWPEYKFSDFEISDQDVFDQLNIHVLDTSKPCGPSDTSLFY